MSSSRWRRSRLSAPEKPLRDELLSIERLEERALALAASLTVDPDPRRRARDTFPRFNDNVRLLRAAYRTLAEDVRTGQFVVPAADWLLDNFHLIASEISDIRRNLPRAYSRTLPALAAREHAGHARVYAIAVELIRHSDSRLDRQQLIQFLNSYQQVAPLTIGELWAWPSMLKLALVENLRRLAEELLSARAARGAADRYVSRRTTEQTAEALPPAHEPAFIVQLLHRIREYGLGLSAVRLAVDDNLALATHDRRGDDSTRAPASGRGPGLDGERGDQPASLRDARLAGVRRSASAWSNSVLQRDPAGAYGRMDFLSRDAQRRAVEELATPSGEGQVRVALKAIETRPAGGGRARRARIAPRTSATTSSTAGAAISKPNSPIGPASGNACAGARCCATRRPCTSARSPC